VHQGDLAGRTAEADEAELEPIDERLTESDGGRRGGESAVKRRGGSLSGRRQALIVPAQPKREPPSLERGPP
jgi:hypothetical protein